MTTTSRRLLALPVAAALGAVLAAGTVSPASAAVSGTGTAGTRPVAAAPASAAKVPFAGQSARSVKLKAVAALKKARTFRVAGRNGSGRSFNLFVSAASAYGDITDSKGTLHVLRIGKTVYLMPDAKLRASEGIPAGYADKWLRVPSSDAMYTSTMAVITPASWASWLGALNVTHRRTGQKVHGLPTLQLWQPGAKGGSLFVATKGAAYPLWAYRNDKDFTYQFVDFDKAFSVRTPSAGQVVALPTT